MNVQRAAFLTLTATKAGCGAGRMVPEAIRSERGRGPEHAIWMLEQVLSAKDWKNDKLNRWLGYAQAILVAWDFIDLEQAKNSNKEA